MSKELIVCKLLLSTSCQCCPIGKGIYQLTILQDPIVVGILIKGYLEGSSIMRSSSTVVLHLILEGYFLLSCDHLGSSLHLSDGQLGTLGMDRHLLLFTCDNSYIMAYTRRRQERTSQVGNLISCIVLELSSLVTILSRNIHILIYF